MTGYTGSDFDDFLRDEGVLEEVTVRARKRLLAMQLADAMRSSHMSRKDLAVKLQTTMAQLERLLDPDDTSVTLDALERLALAVGRKLRIELA